MNPLQHSIRFETSEPVQPDEDSEVKYNHIYVLPNHIDREPFDTEILRICDSSGKVVCYIESLHKGGYNLYTEDNAGILLTRGSLMATVQVVPIPTEKLKKHM